VGAFPAGHPFHGIVYSSPEHDICEAPSYCKKRKRRGGFHFSYVGFIYQRPFYQDRLGTTIGKALKKEVRFVAQSSRQTFGSCVACSRSGSCTPRCDDESVIFSVSSLLLEHDHLLRQSQDNQQKNNAKEKKTGSLFSAAFAHA
jgi:hypothetical protein